MAQDSILCPFCGYKAEDEYRIMLHMETFHSEGGQSPFVPREDPRDYIDVEEEDVQYTSCPRHDCGEMVLIAELDNHIEMHNEEEGENDAETPTIQQTTSKKNGKKSAKDGFGTKLANALRNIDDGHSSPSNSSTQMSAKAAWRDILKMPESSSKSQQKSPPKGPKKLGKAELGPHAHEKQMPQWLVKLLQSDGEEKTINRLDSHGRTRRVRYCVNQAPDIIPVLDQLLEQDPTTEYAYLCDPSVLHISKLNREGGFCGYRNIQMMSSFIVRSQWPGDVVFDGKIPTIFDIQEHIEKAWDLGINATGRIETGGIRGTRKYIGTPDAQAMFCCLGIACDATALRGKKGETSAHQLLYKSVEEYFIDGCTESGETVRNTSLPPIYFQHPGHSMTIIGFEQQTDGTKNILVFDPMFHDAAKLTKLVGTTFRHKSPPDLLKAYRRGNKYLRKYNEFEILKLVPPPSRPLQGH